MENFNARIDRYKEEMTTLIRDKNKDASRLQAYTEQLEEGAQCEEFGFVSFVITDDQSDCPISDANVMITFQKSENCEELLSFVSTNQNGKTQKIKLRVNLEYKVTITANGYETFTHPLFDLKKDEHKQITLSLCKDDLMYEDASKVIEAGESALNRFKEKECCAFPMRVGDEGECVLKLQKAMCNLSRVFDFTPPRLTGKFGQKTACVVGKIQRLFSLTVTYCVDELTWDVIFSANDALNADADEETKMFITFPKNKILSFGDKDEEVALLQLSLIKLSKRFNNITPICLNGEFDEATQKNVSTLQNILGLPSTGRVGNATMSAILKIV